MNQNDNEFNESESKTPNKKSEVIEFVKTIAWVLILAFVIRTFVFTATVVNGESMTPTLQNGDRLIALKFPLYYRGPEYSEIVVLKDPQGSKRDFIKRVIALPGDKVDIIDGKVFVNDKEISEPYIDEGLLTMTADSNSWKLGENQYFVMGDNRHPGGSHDSRAFGQVDKKELVGISTVRFWPINRIGNP